ncbi:translation initiation factor IF-2-like [Phyllostomus hastatus]|uniref:translation initiation factor IF-2-like n=1 Tax=Phyllostomus hastatus TaxID=9423 RepID=UPI001E67E737|nr:translation initiation factor IF-2-like [Phyllostomus hastatus]
MLRAPAGVPAALLVAASRQRCIRTHSLRRAGCRAATLGTTAPSPGRSLAAHCGRRDSRRARRGSVWADRPRGWAGPGPHLDPTSAPSHILEAQVTGGGRRGELRARRGRGSWSAHPQDREVARARLERGGRNQGQTQAPLVRGSAAGPIRTARGAYSASGTARDNGRAPFAGLEEGRKLKLRVGHADARRPKAVGRGGAAASPPPPRGPRGVFSCQTFCTVTAWNHGVEASAGEGAPLSLQPLPRGAPRVGAPPQGSPPLLFPLHCEVCTARRRVRSGRVLGCRPRLGAERPPPHPPQPGSWRAAPGDSGRWSPFPLHALPLLSSGPSAARAGRQRGHGWGGAAPAGGAPSFPGWPPRRPGTQ